MSTETAPATTASPTMETTFTVLGRPQPKQRPRKGANGAWYTPKETRDYEDLIAWHCLSKGVRFGQRPVCVTLTLFETSPGSSGDVDNVAKSILDGMVKGRMIDDDRQVTMLGVSRQPGLGASVHIHVQSPPPGAITFAT